MWSDPDYGANVVRPRLRFPDYAPDYGQMWSDPDYGPITVWFLYLSDEGINHNFSESGLSGRCVMNSSAAKILCFVSIYLTSA